MMWRLLLSTLVLGANMACGAKTRLAVNDNEREVPEVDASLTPDLSTPPLDGDLGLPDFGQDMSVPPDAWVPECPDSVRVRTREASVPVDIIFVIDNSASMLDDIENMRANMTIFWEGIVGADVDSHVVFVSQEGFAPSAPPAFAGRFFRVNERVGSHDGLLKLINKFPDYQRFLRPDAITHFVGITDDDAGRGEGRVFMETMPELLGHDFTFHAVASERIRPTPENPRGACLHEDGFAYSPGYEWYYLADETDGIKLSICEHDWSVLLPPLTERVAVRIPIPCGYSLPASPPPGITYDPDDFTVLYEVPGEPLRVIPRDGMGGCSSGGWNYVEGSKRVELCPNTCDELMALDGRIDIDLGCTTLP